MLSQHNIFKISSEHYYFLDFVFRRTIDVFLVSVDNYPGFVNHGILCVPPSLVYSYRHD